MHDPENPREPKIRFAGSWLPAHRAWRKLETATAVMEAIDRFNDRFPEIATPVTRDVVPLVRRRLREIELLMPVRPAPPDLAEVAVELLLTASPEEVLEILVQQHGAQIDLRQLIMLVGQDAYGAALRREVQAFHNNKISPEQAAELWNAGGRPAPGGGLWTRQKVEALQRGSA